MKELCKHKPDGTAEVGERRTNSVVSCKQIHELHSFFLITVVMVSPLVTVYDQIVDFFPPDISAFFKLQGSYSLLCPAPQDSSKI